MGANNSEVRDIRLLACSRASRGSNTPSTHGREDEHDSFCRHEGSDAAPRRLGAPGEREIRNEDEGRELDRGGQSCGHPGRKHLPSGPSGTDEVPSDEEGDEHVDLTVADGQQDWIQEECGCGQAQRPQSPRPPREVRARCPDRDSEQAEECRLVQQCPQDLGSDRAREALQRHQEQRGERWIREELSPSRVRVEDPSEEIAGSCHVDVEIILVGAGEPEAKDSHERDRQRSRESRAMLGHPSLRPARSWSLIHSPGWWDMAGGCHPVSSQPAQVSANGIPGRITSRLATGPFPSGERPPVHGGDPELGDLPCAASRSCARRGLTTARISHDRIPRG